ncbi:hypothetical protein GLAREA_13089 [Glarea lozoyensis ATCC 20868]|uniref:Uncharacterized protein n=1 Tax=Glarea lozoyensis (strain ATCC 20868 / MF5171) TaxID=1116229 RepID=S3DDH5_GLAL2|nr:uncharacterized protein GLAREA_13089 [Glarea lozoyensis ATCC 20868]EPE30041.1 hypothetical protein GLAREA_13089 [Glarea lozoyensis ATCC 20868]
MKVILICAILSAIVPLYALPLSSFESLAVREPEPLPVEATTLSEDAADAPALHGIYSTYKQYGGSGPGSVEG